MERQVRRALASMWAEQANQFLERLEAHAWRFAETLRESLPDDRLDAIWAAVAAATSGPLEDLLDDLAPRAAREGWTQAAADIQVGISFDPDAPQVRAFLRRFGARRVARINATTRDRLATLLADADRHGWNYARVAREIRGRFRGFNARRSELVAVTELADAFGHGQETFRAEMRREGHGVQMSWLGEDDDRICEICEGNVGAGWVDSTEVFPSGHSREPAHPGCRCTTLTRLVERQPAVA